MGASKKQLQSLYGESWGFGLDSVLRVAQEYESHQAQIDAFSACDACKDTGMVSVTFKNSRGKYKRALAPCSCRIGRLLTDAAP